MRFTIECEMKDRWVQPFLSMLKTMEYDGRAGHSELVGLYADGDGDFRPQFRVTGVEGIERFSPPMPKKYAGGDKMFDADWTPEKLVIAHEHPQMVLGGEDAVRRIEKMYRDGWADKKMEL